MTEEVAGHADRRGSDRVLGDEERGHSAGIGRRVRQRLLEEGLHLVEKSVAVLFHRHAALFGELRE